MTPETFHFGLMMAAVGGAVGFCLGAGIMACIVDYYLKGIARDLDDAS